MHKQRHQCASQPGRNRQIAELAAQSISTPRWRKELQASPGFRRVRLLSSRPLPVHPWDSVPTFFLGFLSCGNIPPTLRPARGPSRKPDPRQLTCPPRSLIPLITRPHPSVHSLCLCPDSALRDPALPDACLSFLPNQRAPMQTPTASSPLQV